MHYEHRAPDESSQGAQIVRLDPGAQLCGDQRLRVRLQGPANPVLALLDMENQQRLARQSAMYDAELPLWKQWQQACDFFDDDLESGYVRVLMEMTAAGWSNPEIARAVSGQMRAWFELLADVAERATKRLGRRSPFTAAELGALAGLPFIGAEAAILLGLDESSVAARSALRKIGELLRTIEEPAKPRRRR